MTTRTLAVSEIAEIVIGFLAAESGIPAARLRADLEAAGPELPVDSLLVVEVLVKVEDACGVRVEVNEEVARSTRSVMTFARSIIGRWR